MLDKLDYFLSKVTMALLGLGCLIVLIQGFWITYGVIVRYVFNNPDGMVTEATALLLVPVAFLGLSYALLTDSYPKVTIFIEIMPLRLQKICLFINQLIMTSVGAFFTASAYSAMVKSFSSGSASEILLWERFYFWVPVFMALLVFTLSAFVMLLRTISNNEK